MLRIRSPIVCALSGIRTKNLIHLKSGKSTGALKDVNQNAAHISHETEEQHGSMEATRFQKLNAREPLVKNFFAGLVDKELLAYPEVINREDFSSLQNNLLPLKNFFDELGNDCTTTTLDNVKSLGLYGINVPLEYDGGKGYNWTSSIMLSQPECQYPSIALALLSHRVVIDFLRVYGSKEQMQRYFSRLASGELVATEAIYEYTAPEEDFFNTKAIYSPETGRWVLNGEKAFVITGPLPLGSIPLFLVIAQTQHTNVSNDSGRGTTLFLIEGNQEGVHIGEKHLNFGFTGTEMRRVQFNEVQIREENILGLPHDGNKYAERLMLSGRLRTAMIGMTMAKNSLNQMAAFCVESKQCGAYLKDMEIVGVNLSNTMCKIYAMESMVYLTAGLLDEFNDQDVTLEAAIVKYYTLKQLYDLVSQNLMMVGPKSLHSGQPNEVALRNAAQLCTLGESMNTLALFIALSGLQHAGGTMNEVVRKSRNPLFHPGHIFSKFIENSSIENPNTKMGLSDNVHPTLSPAALCIEHSVARLQMSAELMFTRHGNTIVQRHNELQRIADISSTIYAMFASVARASRSYCIGLPFADNELLTASAICISGRDYVKLLSTEILNGHYVNNDNNLLRLASQITKCKGYYAVHPLTYNF